LKTQTNPPSVDPNARTNIEHIAIVPISRWQFLDLKEIWQYRELFFFLAWRDIKVRYKQTVLGAMWAVLQPLLTMVLFTVIFGLLIRVDTAGAPYPVFALAALLPWQLFAFALTHASNSLVDDKNLVTKVYFPRIIVPLSSVAGGMADFLVASVILIGMLFFYGIPMSYRILTLPLFVLFALASALAVGLWLSALIVKYRDFRYVIPFLTQFWMYATPIAYATSLIPEQWRSLYALNPMVGVVEGFRWALLGSVDLDLTSLMVSAGVVLVLFITGLLYFRRIEDSFADVI
jgi:lipopolysaccharide transport system permease protein